MKLERAEETFAKTRAGEREFPRIRSTSDAR
jgi:hypothetical protein